MTAPKVNPGATIDLDEQAQRYRDLMGAEAEERQRRERELELERELLRRKQRKTSG